MNKPQIIQFKEQRVLTSSQLAEAFGTDAQKIQQNYWNNRDRYLESKHFFLLQGDELKLFKSNIENFEVAANVNRLYLWTEKGAWLHAKSLGTDEAWDAYEQLVDNYYQLKEIVLSPEALMANAFKEMARMAEAVAATKETVEYHDLLINRLDHEITNVMTIDHPRQRKIQKSVATRVYNFSEDKQERSGYFRELHRELKDRFGVSSYTDIKHKDFESAVAYIDAWIPRRV